MSKVVIYEDSEEDLISRYGVLTKDHDVHVRHDPRGSFGPSSLRWDHESFKEYGFNPDNFMDGFGVPQDENADVYFLDGLNSYCFEILDHLPKEKSFINTDSFSIEDEARKRGFNLVTQSVENIVTQFC
ncbi:hypothetical protein J4477_02540 [Candidatus Pacearchaeota archaeon]|nr:hypothetical protein [Candidatus Pacearchaeota archaeon]